MSIPSLGFATVNRGAPSIGGIGGPPVVSPSLPSGFSGAPSTGGVNGPGGGSSGLTLSFATVNSGAPYMTGGSVTPPGGNAGVSFLGEVVGSVYAAPYALDVYNGSMAQAIASAGGSAAFLTGDAQGLAVSGAPAKSQGVADISISYLFWNQPLPAGTSFLFWQTGAGDQGAIDRFTVSAAGAGSQPINTADWHYEIVEPFGTPTGATVSSAGGVITIQEGNAPGTDPDALVAIIPTTPVKSVTVEGAAGAYNTWGVAMGSAAAQNDAPCFLAGTAILTERGPVPVERLRVGDRVPARRAGMTPITWLGRRRIDLARHNAPARVLPFRILKDAIAPGVPARDLLLSPDHAVALGGVLIPVKCLANGLTIFQDTGFGTVEYWHVELPRHDVLLAEALPVESYLDTGNRLAFENAGPALHLHPVFAAMRWERDACGRLCEAGAPVDDLRALLLARARALIAAAAPARRQAGARRAA